MEFNHKYNKSSYIEHGPSTTMSFAPDLNREPVHFIGNIHRKIAFREAISALHDVVTSDVRFKPKDRTEYKEWAKQQEQLWLSEYMSEIDINTVNEEISILRNELGILSKEKNRIIQPFYNARSNYFSYLYKKDLETWRILDPIISVHPDELFFECFSIDESSYGKLSCNHNIFEKVIECQCGTTNVDYSDALYNEFQRIRNYKETKFIIDPSGFEVKTSGAEEYKEVKIDVPDSWVRGFLQVSSAMTLPATEFDLHPMDVHALCQYLRRHKEQNGPRALRYILKPGQAIQVMFEPWNELITFHRSIYTGNQNSTIRVWGRRRLHILERLIPVAKSFKVILLGNGLPSFYMAQLEEMTFTLGLSGWTRNDWTKSAQFDLLASRSDVSLRAKLKTFDALKKDWLSTTTAIGSKTGMTSAEVASSFTALTQAGKVIFDLNKKVYRCRELSQNPIDLNALRFQSPQETLAQEIIDSKTISIANKVDKEQLIISGNCKLKKGFYNTKVVLDKDQTIISAECQCDYFKSNGIKQGPCEHILATAKAFRV